LIRESLNLADILIGLENALKIEYKEKDVERIKSAARQRLEAAFQVRIVGSIYETQASNRLVGDNLSILLASVMEGMKSLALLLSVTMFDRKLGMTVRDINYIGFAKENLQAALKFLQDEVLYETRDSFFPQIVQATGHVEMSTIKRLLVIMIVMEDLGIKEGVGLIAQYLYLGGQ
jgi:hypothetical protein